MDQTCPRCELPLSPEMNFCPRCGKKLKTPPPLTSVAEQIKVYLVCLLAPPFGFFYTYRYLKSGGRKEKIIGYATLALNAAAIIILVLLTRSLINTANQYSRNLSF